jgi:hypothetical protein
VASIGTKHEGGLILDRLPQVRARRC